MSINWKKTLAAVAPLLGSAVGGPFGLVAGRAIGAALLGKPDASEDELEAAVLSADPAALLKLRAAEQQFKADMKKLDVDLEKIAASDRANARDRQIKTGDPMPAVIALAALAGFFGILGAMVFVVLPPGAAAPLNVMLGTLGGLVLSIGNYYFGSSRGSAEKTEMLKRMMK